MESHITDSNISIKILVEFLSGKVKVLLVIFLANTFMKKHIHYYHIYLNALGFYDFQSTLRNGQRCSTAKSYLVPAENRTNLHILSNAMVTQVSSFILYISHITLAVSTP